MAPRRLCSRVVWAVYRAAGAPRRAGTRCPSCRPGQTASCRRRRPPHGLRAYLRAHIKTNMKASQSQKHFRHCIETFST